uniref:SKIP_SNW domain-containing protein n=1 Tax=Onchocerca flexuosa TaxID=387005 RepID=A0A183I4B4_9BILA
MGFSGVRIFIIFNGFVYNAMKVFSADHIVASALPVRHAQKPDPVQYIRYTPSQQGGGHNSGAQQRIIRMVEVQQDPMEPPKFKINQKIPRAPSSPPAPIMHSPPRKVFLFLSSEFYISFISFFMALMF